MFDNILIKTPEQIEGIGAACRDAALVLDYIERLLKPASPPSTSMI